MAAVRCADANSGLWLRSDWSAVQSLPVKSRRAFLVSAVALGLTAHPAFTSSVVTASTTPSASNCLIDPSYSAIADFTSAFCHPQQARTLIDFVAIRQQGLPFLDRYLRCLSGVPAESLSPDGNLAYWLNTRNLLVVEAIAKAGAYRDLATQRGTKAEPGPLWVEKRFVSAGDSLSIHDIEQVKILARWPTQPNVLYGLYQGARGGPKLGLAGFSEANVHSQLEQLGVQFVHSIPGIQPGESTFRLPAIYSWYLQSLFGGEYDALTRHIAGLMDGAPAKNALVEESAKRRPFNYRSDVFALRKQAAPIVTVEH